MFETVVVGVDSRGARLAPVPVVPVVVPELETFFGSPSAAARGGDWTYSHMSGHCIMLAFFQSMIIKSIGTRLN